MTEREGKDVSPTDCMVLSTSQRSGQRFVDGNGRSCSTLDIYRAVMAMEAADNWEGHRGDDVYADLARQMERGR